MEQEVARGGTGCFALALVRIVDSHNALYAIFFVAVHRKSATLLGVQFKLFSSLQYSIRTDITYATLHNFAVSSAILHCTLSLKKKLYFIKY